MNLDSKVVLVKRNSRLDELVARFNSVSQARFYIEHLGADFSDYRNEHDDYNRALAAAHETLLTMARVHVLDRKFLSNYLFGEKDIVVAIGQDGLVANTMKYLSCQPLIGVNPAPKRWDGVLLPFKADDLTTIVPEVLRNRRGYKEVSMARVTLNNGQTMLAVNDFFIGQKTHVSARYRIRYKNEEENHSSSGIIVSTGLGSTGWLKSILTGSAGIVNAIRNQSMSINAKGGFDWNSNHLYFSVREPFPSRTTATTIVFGKIDRNSPFTVLSHMGENGVIFSDGIENDYLEFNSGIEATVDVAENRGRLIV